MNLFYTSDSHFFHTNMLSFLVECQACPQIPREAGDPCPECQGAGKVRLRPFSSSEEMNEILIQEWNKVVGPEDHVWHLGDVSMLRGKVGEVVTAGLITRLNGRKRLILGNHDHLPAEAYLRMGFEKVQGSHVHEGLLFTHIPVHPGSLGWFQANIHGHTHANPDLPPVLKGERWTPYLNICVERTLWRPISLEEVKEKVAILASGARWQAAKMAEVEGRGDGS